VKIFLHGLGFLLNISSKHSLNHKEYLRKACHPMNLLNFYQKQTLFFLPNLQLQNQILKKKKKSHFKVLSKQ
jgi:hypothetical protein